MQDCKFKAVAELVRCFSRTLDSVLQGPGGEEGSQSMIAAISAQCQDKAAGEHLPTFTRSLLCTPADSAAPTNFVHETVSQLCAPCIPALRSLVRNSVHKVWTS